MSTSSEYSSSCSLEQDIEFLLNADPSLVTHDDEGMPRGGLRGRLQPVRWADHVENLNDREFHMAYRMPIHVFEQLVVLLRPRLVCHLTEQNARNSSGRAAIEAEIMVAMTLRWLAGSPVIDLRLIYHVAVQTCRRILWVVVDAINASITFSFPKTRTEWERAAEAFATERSRVGPDGKYVWDTQIAALDGCHFPQANPGVAVPNAQDYYVSRKGMYALLSVAACDAYYRFVLFEVRSEPNTADSLAWEMTDIGQWAKNGGIAWPYFIGADAAYVQADHMVIPSFDDDFNYEQSRMRMFIEQAFGILINRWGILWRPLKMRFNRRPAVILACARLHNWLIDRRIAMPKLNVNSAGQKEVVPGRWVRPPYLDEDGCPTLHTANESGLRSSTRRPGARTKDLIDRVRAAGLKRPATRAQHERARNIRRRVVPMN